MATTLDTGDISLIRTNRSSELCLGQLGMDAGDTHALCHGLDFGTCPIILFSLQRKNPLSHMTSESDGILNVPVV